MTLALVAPPFAMPNSSPSPEAPSEAPCAAAGAWEGPSSVQTEADLAELLRHAGPQVKGALLNRFAPTLKLEDVEDVFSIALHRVWKHRARFDAQKSSLKTWFYCIAQRAALDFLKLGWQKARQLEVEWTEPPASQSPASPDEESAENSPTIGPNGMQQALQTAMAQLSDVQRQIIWADALGAKQGGISSEQLGSELGIPAGTVRVYRKRAMERLRQILRESHSHLFSDEK
jgi:RNA polymerase sigma factor (sigma-70 family)